MNMNQLRVFHTVAKCRSFTLAAEKLYLTQPGISKHIKQLEEYYNIKLFNRLGKKVVPSQAGEILLNTTGQIFNLLDESRKKIDDLKGLTGGQLKIGASFTLGIYVIPKILGEFRRNYPGVDVDLDISLSHQIEKKILTNQIDVGFTGSSTSDNRLFETHFLSDKLSIIIPADHQWRKRKYIRPQELAEQLFIFSKIGSGTRTIIENRFKKIGITLNHKIEFGNTEAVKRAVMEGIGVSILSRLTCIDEIKSGVLKTINLRNIDINRNFYMIYHRHKYITNIEKAFLDLVEQNKFNFHDPSELRLSQNVGQTRS